MQENKNLTLPGQALAIMGKDNFIGLDEALSVFPSNKADLTGLDIIPYSQELLYTCSEAETPFLLFPGLQRIGSKKSFPLTISNMRRYFKDLTDLFTPRLTFVSHAETPAFNYEICMPRWYLISKKALTEPKAAQFFVNTELGDIWRAERAVVYVYAWILMKLARKEHIFRERQIACSDPFPGSKILQMALDFGTQKITVHHWKAIPTLPLPDCAPSVNPYGQPASEYKE